MPEDKPKRKKQTNTKLYAQYYGMAFQLFGLLLVSMLIGLQIDKYLGNETKYVAVLFCLIVLIAYFYKLIVVLGKNK